MQYTNKVLEHFKKPHNQGSMKKPDAVGEVGNPSCGDVMKIYIKVNQKKVGLKSKQDVIQDVKFETLGCAAAIAVSSALTDLVKGKTIEKASKINKDNVVKSLGGLPAPKIHCSMLGIDALREAINSYLIK